MGLYFNHNACRNQMKLSSLLEPVNQVCYSNVLHKHVWTTLTNATYKDQTTTKGYKCRKHSLNINFYMLPILLSSKSGQRSTKHEWRGNTSARLDNYVITKANENFEYLLNGNLIISILELPYITLRKIWLVFFYLNYEISHMIDGNAFAQQWTSTDLQHGWITQRLLKI